LQSFYHVVSSGGSFWSTPLQQELHRKYIRIDALIVDGQSELILQVFIDIAINKRLLIIEREGITKTSNLQGFLILIGSTANILSLKPFNLFNQKSS